MTPARYALILQHALCRTWLRCSTIGGGCNKFVPVLGGDGTKIVPPGDLFDKSPGEMNRIRGKLADHAGDNVVLSPEGVVFVPSPGTESSCPRPPHSLEHSALHSQSIHLLVQGRTRKWIDDVFTQYTYIHTYTHTYTYILCRV